MANPAQYQVTRADIANLLGGEGGVDLERVMRDGKQVAMRVVGVQPGTTAARLGARDGDTIEAINDIQLTSIARAYDAADSAVRHGRIVITGARDGEPYETVLVLSS